MTTKVIHPEVLSPAKVKQATREMVFVNMYLANGRDGTQAAIAAGYSKSSARSVAQRLMNLPHIRTQIEIDAAELSIKHNLTADRVLAELEKIAFADPRKMFDSGGRMKAIHDMDDSTAGAIASVETDELRQEGMSVGVTRKVKLLDKVAALNMAMKFFGMFEKDNNQKQPVVLQMTQVDVDL